MTIHTAPIYTDKPVYSWTDKVENNNSCTKLEQRQRPAIDSIGDDNDNPIKISTRGHII